MSKIEKTISYRPVDFYSDITNTDEFVKQHSETTKYCKLWDKWLIWDGHRWKIDDTDEIKVLAKQTVISLYGQATQYINDDDKRKKIIDNAKRSESLAKRHAMIEGAKSEIDIAVTPKMFDQNIWLFNIGNGTINLRTSEFSPHQKEDCITRIVPINYEPKAKCPMWHKFLKQVFDNNEELIEFIQKSVGYSLTGSNQEQCMFMLYGTGANGKSTFINVIQDILGEYSQQASSDAIMSKKAGANSNDIASLKGARFVSFAETEDGRSFSEVMLKQLTGGDKVSVRFLFQEFFELQPEFKIWITGNHKPIIKGTDYAIWRRIRLIPFNVTIQEKERDNFLSDKLKMEKEGILAWAIEGCRKWLRDGLYAPDIVKCATEEYKQDMDIVGDFIKECCQISDGVQTPASKLYNTFISWGNGKNGSNLSQTVFGTNLASKGIRKEHCMRGPLRGKTLYNNITLNSEVLLN